MDVQNIFYIFAIIYLSLNIIILLAIVIGIFYVIKTVKDIRSRVDEKIKQVQDLIKDPEELIAKVAATCARSFFNRIKKTFSRKESEV